MFKKLVCQWVNCWMLEMYCRYILHINDPEIGMADVFCMSRSSEIELADVFCVYFSAKIELGDVFCIWRSP